MPRLLKLKVLEIYVCIKALYLTLFTDALKLFAGMPQVKNIYFGGEGLFSRCELVSKVTFFSGGHNDRYAHSLSSLGSDESLKVVLLSGYTQSSAEISSLNLPRVGFPGLFSDYRLTPKALPLRPQQKPSNNSTPTAANSPMTSFAMDGISSLHCRHISNLKVRELPSSILDGESLTFSLGSYIPSCSPAMLGVLSTYERLQVWSGASKQVSYRCR